MFNLYISNIINNTKPTTSKIKYISKTILNCFVTNISIQEFAEQLTVLGKTVVLCQLSFPTLSKSTPIISQELVMLDFDNKDSNNIYTLDDLENDEFIQNNALFYYKTFSDENSDVDKFRVVFQLPYKITNNKEIEDIYQELFKRYPMSDTSIGQTSRMFFGSNQGYEVIDFDNRLKLSHELSIKNKEELLNYPTPNYILLKQKNYEKVKEKLKLKYSNIFPDDINAYNYFCNIDIQEFLELPNENPFHDILHEESSPSASVFFSQEHQIYLYKCFSTRKQYVGNIFNLLVKYLELDSKIDALNIILLITSSSINYSSELGVQKKLNDIFRKELITGKLATTYPYLYTYLEKYKEEINVTLDLMYDYSYIDKSTGEVRYLNYLSLESLTNLVSKAINKKISKKKMWNILNIIVVTEMVDKLNYQDMPPELYKNLIENQLSDIQIRTSNVYEPKKFTDNILDSMSDIAEVLVLNNITVNSLSFDLIYRLFGEEKAKKDFPQAYDPLEKRGIVKLNPDKSTTKENESLEKLIFKTLKSELLKNNYVFESKLISKIAKSRNIKVATMKYKVNKILPAILMDNDLIKVRLTKDLYDSLHIDESFSKKSIIIKKGDFIV